MAVPQSDVRTAPAGTALVRFGNGSAPAPAPSPAPALVLSGVSTTGQVGTPGAATVSNSGPGSANWSAGLNNGASAAPSSGTLASGASVNLALNYVAAATHLLTLVNGSGGAVSGGTGGNGTSSIVVTAPAPAPAPSAGANLLQGELRQAQTDYLFQRVTALELAVPAEMSGVAGNAPWRLDVWGPTSKLVDQASGWAWENVGGDWIDATGARQGDTPWLSTAANSGSGAAYSVDSTALAKEVFLQREHFAVLLGLAAGSGARTIAGQFNSNAALRPVVDVTYVAGASFTASSGETAGAYIGTWASMTQADPTEPDQYNWVAAGGATLPNGTAGYPYMDPATASAAFASNPVDVRCNRAVAHVAYADSADGATNFNRTSGAYIGTYADYTLANSNSPGAYVWRLVSSLTANQGVPCLNTVSGTTAYLHWKFSPDGGRTETLTCHVSGGNSSGSALPNTTSQTIALPAFLEFDKPSEPVARAVLRFVVTTQWSGNATITGQWLHPRKNHKPTDETGVATTGSAFDAGLAARPGVIGTMSFPDGTTLADVTPATVPGATSSESSYSPEFFTSGATPDTSKFPHVGHSKLLNTSSPQGSISVVNSAYAGEGFAPLFPDMGAIRLHMPAMSTTHGESYDALGQVVSQMQILLPPAQYGSATHLFTRFYVRLGSNLATTPDTRRNVIAGGVPEWSTKTGKWAITPSAANSYGGFSGSSGGGYGYQFRGEYACVDAGAPGPIDGGIVLKWHMYDYQGNNPVGYQYGTEWDADSFRWGSLGGVLYRGAWYCVETEVQANSISGTAPGYTADGVMRAWVDDRLVFEQTGMVFRTGPVQAIGYIPSKLRPTLNLGFTHIDLNFFEGGHTRSPDDRTVFYTALAWGTQRIGRMNTRPADSWLPAAGDVALIGYASGSHPQSLPATLNDINPSNDPAKNPYYGTATNGGLGPWFGGIPTGYGPYGWNTFPGYTCPAYDPVNRRSYTIGGGHGSVTVGQAAVHDVVKRAWSWAGPVIPEDGLTRLVKQNGPNYDFPLSVIQAGYSAAEFDPVEMHWNGASGTWGAGFKHAGTIAPVVGHTWFQAAWVPGSVWGNRNGAILNLAASSGVSNVFENTVVKRQALNLDTGEWEVTRNRRHNVGGGAGGAVYHRGVNALFVVQTATGLAAYTDKLAVLTSRSEGWQVRTATNEIYANFGGGLAEHLAGNLLLHFQGLGASMLVWACDATAAKNGGHTWTQLTVTGPWPQILGGASEIGWLYFKRTGKLYAVTGRGDSALLYTLNPPAGWTTQASLLAGTWSITTETLAHALGTRNTGASTGGDWQVYNSLVDDGNSMLLYDDDVTNRGPAAITPAGA